MINAVNRLIIEALEAEAERKKEIYNKCLEQAGGKLKDVEDDPYPYAVKQKAERMKEIAHAISLLKNPATKTEKQRNEKA